MDPRQAIAVTVNVAEALAYAWNRAQLIHRDIKPANIFLSREGEVKLGDLGLAKSLLSSVNVTQTGAIMGTPHYMSPEQGRGDSQIDFRTDIYSLGCALYHMLTGHPPFPGETRSRSSTSTSTNRHRRFYGTCRTAHSPWRRWLNRMLAKNRNGRPRATKSDRRTDARLRDAAIARCAASEASPVHCDVGICSRAAARAAHRS